MADKTDWYKHLRQTLYQFACGPMPLDQWRTRAEVEQALKWLEWLDRMQERIDMNERPTRVRRKKKTADIIELPPRLN